MDVTPLEKTQRDKARQWSIYRAAIRKDRQRLADSGCADDIKKIIAFIRVNPDDPGPPVPRPPVPELLRLADPFIFATRETIHLVVSIIDDHIIRNRVRNGLAPFDDPIEGSSNFLSLRKLLTGV